MKVYILCVNDSLKEAYLDKYKANIRCKELRKTEEERHGKMIQWWRVEEVEVKDANALP